jgi:hypothetical protein
MLASFLRLEIGYSLSIAGLLGCKLDGIGRSEVISSWGSLLQQGLQD